MSRRRSLLHGSPRSPKGASVPPSSAPAAPEGREEATSGDSPVADGSADPLPAEEEAAAGPPTDDASEPAPDTAPSPHEEAASPEAPVGADGVALSAQPTQPPAPRQELPPGLADMQTPLRPDRQPLPESFQETPMGADWYVGTGQPLPAREGAPPSKTQAGLPVPVIVGGMVLVGIVLCAGLLFVVF